MNLFKFRYLENLNMDDDENGFEESLVMPDDDDDTDDGMSELEDDEDDEDDLDKDFKVPEDEDEDEESIDEEDEDKEEEEEEEDEEVNKVDQNSDKRMNDSINSVVLKKHELTAGDATKWTRLNMGEMTQLRKDFAFNEKYGPTAYARNQINESVLSAFFLLVDHSMLDTIVEHTNREAKSHGKAFRINKNDLLAFIAILYGRGVLCPRRSVKMIFSLKYGQPKIRTLLSRDKFAALMRFLRFDNKEARKSQTVPDKFIHIRQIWETFVDNSVKCYTPNKYLTIDEQLFPCKTKCSFIEYIPRKPGKYGIKFWILSDVESKYMINAKPYLGKDAHRIQTESVGEHIVKSLMSPYFNKGYCVTTDTFFSSVKLARDLLNLKTTFLATLSNNRKSIPPILKRNHNIQATVFLDDGMGVMLTSYQQRLKRNVILISTEHETASVNEKNKKKPCTVETYNKTKVGVDTIDQMSKMYSVKAATKRWPVGVFYNILNLAAINAWILYKAANNSKISREKFILKIMEEIRELIGKPKEPLIATDPSNPPESNFNLKRKRVHPDEEMVKEAAKRQRLSNPDSTESLVRTVKIFNNKKDSSKEQQNDTTEEYIRSALRASEAHGSGNVIVFVINCGNNCSKMANSSGNHKSCTNQVNNIVSQLDVKSKPQKTKPLNKKKPTKIETKKIKKLESPPPRTKIRLKNKKCQIKKKCRQNKGIDVCVNCILHVCGQCTAGRVMYCVKCCETVNNKNNYMMHIEESIKQENKPKSKSAVKFYRRSQCKIKKCNSNKSVGICAQCKLPVCGLCTGKRIACCLTCSNDPIANKLDSQSTQYTQICQEVALTVEDEEESRDSVSPNISTLTSQSYFTVDHLDDSPQQPEPQPETIISQEVPLTPPFTSTLIPQNETQLDSNQKEEQTISLVTQTQNDDSIVAPLTSQNSESIV